MHRFMLRAIACLLIVCSQVATAADYWAPHWSARMGALYLQADVIGPGAVMLLGDSNTEAFYWTSVGGCRIVNAGFGGARIKQLVDIAQQLSVLYKPKVVHVMIGTNNVTLPPESQENIEAQQDLISVAKAFRSQGAKVVFWPIMPIGKNAGTASTQPNRASLNLSIQNASTLTGSLFDWWFPLLYEGDDGWSKPGTLAADGFHFSAETQRDRYNRIEVWNQYIETNAGVHCD